MSRSAREIRAALDLLTVADLKPLARLLDESVPWVFGLTPEYVPR